MPATVQTQQPQPQRKVPGFEEPVKPTAMPVKPSAMPKKSSVTVHDLTEMKTSRQASTLIATSGRDNAIHEAREKVERISRDCRLHNVKYRDPHFDLSETPNYCLFGLPAIMAEDEGVSRPAEARRVAEIYDNPKFIVDGIDAGDIRQGAAGDCWFLAAVATIANMPGLLESICVARDEQVGVYGFIFFRDGEWVSEVVDDQLFIKAGEYAQAPEDMRKAFEDEDQYSDALQKGSKALHFAHCADSNETWLPLLEKAFAKIHGDYSAIESGLTGEGVEDLTGGVTSEIITRDILDKNRFWTEELSKVNKEFLFAGAIFRDGVARVKGILTGHAYSVLRAVETNGLRLVQVRNPWGKTEWTGAWSDGSPEWTPEWMTILNHRFGDDGAFWMSYDDFLKTFTLVDRTRIFTSEWRVAQCWTKEVVTWPTHKFNTTEFVISLAQPGPVVIVLQQADSRYFKGLEGQYRFKLHFRVRRDGETEYYSRSKQAIIMSRSINTELNLEAGTWRVSYKITRQFVGRKSRTEYISTFSEKQSEKFVAVARNFDYSLALNAIYTGDEKEVEEAIEEALEEVEHEQPEGEEATGEQQAPSEEAAAEQPAAEGDAAAAAAKAQQEAAELLDSIAMVGIRVHAKDPEMRVVLEQGVESAAEWEVDPDDSFVKSFHTLTGNQGAIISKLAK